MIKQSKYFLLVFCILLVACQPENQECFKSLGEIQTQDIELDSFESIVLEDLTYLNLIQDTAYGATLEGGKNILPFIECEVRDNVLYITDLNKCDWLRSHNPPIVNIKFPTLNKILIKECGIITCEDTLHLNNFLIENQSKLSDINISIDCNRLTVKTHAGTGDFIFKGNCQYAKFYNIGNGHLDSKQLECNTAYIVHRSTGNITINVSNVLMVEDLQHGFLNYYGCPILIDANEAFLPRMFDMGYYE